MGQTFKQYWETGSQKFEALNNREKRLVFGAILCVFYGIYTAFIEPVANNIQKINTEIQKNESEQHSLELQLNILTQKSIHPTKSAEKIKAEALNENVALLSDKIEHLKSALISPKKVPDLLNDLLSQDQNLRLVNLKTLDSTGLFAHNEKHANHAHALPVFKHGVEMTIEGRYLDLTQYIEKLERMPWHILWEKAVIEVEKNPESPFPLSQLTLVVYSLSLDKAWLSI